MLSTSLIFVHDYSSQIGAPAFVTADGSLTKKICTRGGLGGEIWSTADRELFLITEPIFLANRLDIERLEVV